ncbi:MAG: hypothetical protein M3Y21_01440 [Candidatus Eremiobacteraeota bacterium]|nr:hypothetical protein [Candidatus Eremiobacteraeota bacterium]
MGKPRWTDNRMLGWALLGSVFLHFCLALLWPALLSPAASVAEPIENISFARLSRMQITTPSPTKRVVSEPRRVAKAAPRKAPLHRGAVRRSAVQHSLKRAQQNTPSVSEQATQVAAAPQAPAQTTEIANAAPPVATQTSAPPQRSAAPTQVVAQANGHDAGGVMPFGATLDTPVLDPRVKSALQARFKLGVTVVVVVGDDGKTKSITFHPPQDPAVESQIRSMLASANWDPAVCGGGIACEKSAELKL